MPPFESRLDLYEYLAANKAPILAEAQKIAVGLGIPVDLKGRFGTSGANSSLPGALRSDIVQAIERDAMQVRPLKHLGDEIRRTVKSVYGDDYDAAPTNSCEAAIGVAFDALMTPPLLGRGEPYRARCIGLIERHCEHHLSYGRPFPPRYKDLFADRGATAGELGIAGRANLNTDIVMVSLAGASYALHGIKFFPTPLLMNTDAAATTKALSRAAKHSLRATSAAFFRSAMTRRVTAAARKTTTARHSCSPISASSRLSTAFLTFATTPGARRFSAPTRARSAPT